MAAASSSHSSSTRPAPPGDDEFLARARSVVEAGVGVRWASADASDDGEERLVEIFNEMLLAPLLQDVLGHGNVLSFARRLAEFGLRQVDAQDPPLMILFSPFFCGRAPALAGIS